MDIRLKTVRPLSVGEHLIYFLALLPDEGGLLLAQELPLHPWELYLLPLGADGAGESVRLTHLYDDRLAEFTWIRPERVRYRGSNNDEIDSWLIRPVGAREGVRYPLLLAIHGGPQWAFGVGMDILFQYFAAQGFAVF
jgi:dipeptidyl aminopeptidase/acylaminoacyl peptidase